MKAITIWQPWASLIACGAKKFETRSWKTDYRGPIAIHAAARYPFKATKDIPGYVVAEMRQALKSFGILTNWTDFRNLPLGKIIATADLVDCHEIMLYGGRGISAYPGRLEMEDGIYYPDEQELLFGDWTPGRYAWELANVKMLPEPISCKGKQRLWEVEI